MSASTRQKAPVSEERYEIQLAVRGRMAKLSATVRPPNFDELRGALAFTDGGEQKLSLFEACAVEFDEKLPITARRAIGHQILELAGNDLTAVEVSEHDLSDEAGAALEGRREKSPGKEFVCLSMDDREYLFLAPHENIIDTATSKKKTSGIQVDLGVVEQHCFFGDLEYLKREKPAGIAELFQRLCVINGATVVALVKKV